MSQYHVTAPYVTLKVLDLNGQIGFQGFYRGTIVGSDQVDEESLKRHVDRGMVEEFAVSEPETAEEPPEEGDSAGRPGQNEPKQAWVDYAVDQDVADRDEAEAMTKAELIDLFK